MGISKRRKSLAANSQVFLLGAGFSVDASSEAGFPIVPYSGLKAKYPMIGELLKSCFGIAAMPTGKSIEDLFQDSIDRHDPMPFEALCDMLMEADYYIADRLKSGGSHSNNVYRKFLENFPESPLLTYNYDSLLEVLLLANRTWCPIDGYGVQVKAFQRTIRYGKQPVSKSIRHVLHLHGSLCVYAVTFYIEKSHDTGPNMLRFDRDPQFIFNPEEIGICFLPFEKVSPGPGYELPPERVIAPIPDKAEGLKGAFIKAMYDRAAFELKKADQIISIGYSFNPHDRSSYEKLLSSFHGKAVLLVGPDAKELAKRLASEYTNIEWKAESKSFRDWVNSDYPGVFKHAHC